MPELEFVVGIAELKVAESPCRLNAFGLGSCVGITIYDRLKKIGGLAHVMLPSSRLYTKSSFVGKFADTAIEALIDEMLRLGCKPSDMDSKLIGGANMFPDITQKSVSIGLRNVAAAREKLGEKGIPILSTDVGGVQGRSAFFFLEDGRVEIRKMNQSLYSI